MNKIVNKFLLGNIFMPEHLRRLDLLIAIVEHLQKTREELKIVKKQEIQAIFTKVSLIRLVFNMICCMEILKIEKEEQLLMKFYEIKHLILLMMRVNKIYN